MPIRVSIVEDNEEIREGLAVLINGSPGYRCVAMYANAERALAAVEQALRTRAGEGEVARH